VHPWLALQLAREKEARLLNEARLHRLARLARKARRAKRNPSGPAAPRNVDLTEPNGAESFNGAYSHTPAASASEPQRT
jgi:hypothetical protein